MMVNNFFNYLKSMITPIRIHSLSISLSTCSDIRKIGKTTCKSGGVIRVFKERDEEMNQEMRTQMDKQMNNFVDKHTK